MILNYEDFLFEYEKVKMNESTKSFRDYLKVQEGSAIQKFLDDINDILIEQIDSWEVEYVKKFNKKPKDYEKEIQKLIYVYDLVRSIEFYLKPTDEIVTSRYYVSRKGSYEVRAQIKRDDKIYDFETEVILAGGYNIQTLHYRYIVHTNLPKSFENTITNELKEKIKTLNKNEKLEEEIERYEIYIKNIENKKNREDFTDEEVLDILRKKEDGYFAELEKLDWEEIVRRGADINYENEQDFLKQQEEYKKSSIKSWLTINTYSKEEKKKKIAEYQKQIQKIKAKIK